jgi:protein-S-isoprenylcysteine O-methyltransferase Ste14
MTDDKIAAHLKAGVRAGLGGLAIVVNSFGTWCTFRENVFAASVVNPQEGQQVFDTGPYAIVRHQMYASALFLLIGLPLLLGSWIGLGFAVPVHYWHRMARGARRARSVPEHEGLQGLHRGCALSLYSIRLVTRNGGS